MDIFIQIVGWGGTFLFVISFILVSSKKIGAQSNSYELMNLLGAIGVGIGAFSKYDWPSVGLQIIWGAISIFFLIKIWHDKRHKIGTLFICQGNMLRSQIAEALYKKYKKGNTFSAGIFPIIENHIGKKLEKIMSKEFLNAMKDKENLNLSKNICKEITPEMVKKAKTIIVMTNKEIWPDFLKNRKDIIYWEVENPESADYKKYSEIIDAIKEKVLSL
ncbi:MAG: hypothetical protein WC662_03430 [Candidatus Paceibacterota bacterium]|jgi:protein-tyrosine-phosphatase